MKSKRVCILDLKDIPCVNAIFCTKSRQFKDICLHDAELAEEIGLCDERLYEAAPQFDEWAAKTFFTVRDFKGQIARSTTGKYKICFE